ncbi:GTPase HflX-like isoform X6 [Triticum dicoccoides]|uniref:GTPase HflX-like isoform X6 n=1 Tax=Triticum dicoccoides TaxID=85692 RepID=UPI00188E9612|nr:GTPase HflX-like isoform X6 [Triticum dicoccoides]
MRAACFCLSFTAASPPLPSTSTAASSPRCQSHASYRRSQPRHSRGGVVRALHERLLETPTPAPAETEVEDESGVGEIEDGGEREGRDGQADIVGPSEAQEQPKSRRRQQQEEEDATAERARFKLINGKEIFQEKTYLVGVECKRAARDNFSIEESLKELEQLADTAGLMVLGSTYQKQLRNLEKSFGGGVRVCDRTALILDIFNQRAVTHEAALQVTLAQMEYQLPRLTKLWTHLERQSGGQVKGMGEKQIEVDKRILRTQISTLRKELESVRKHRKLYRNRRRSVPIPVVSLVGYTNAGKSTLLNRLTGADVLAEDKLFATLDPTTRRVLMKSGTEFLLTDTVGFIQKLPTMLVAAFRATLEEISESSIIVHLADISCPGLFVNPLHLVLCIPQTEPKIFFSDRGRSRDHFNIPLHIRKLHSIFIIFGRLGLPNHLLNLLIFFHNIRESKNKVVCCDSSDSTLSCDSRIGSCFSPWGMQGDFPPSPVEKLPRIPHQNLIHFRKEIIKMITKHSLCDCRNLLHISTTNPDPDRCRTVQD